MTIVLTEFEPPDLQTLDEKWLMQIGKFYSEAGPAYTALQDGKAIAAAGLVIDPQTRTAHAWGSITDKARANPFFLHRITCRLLALEMDKNQIGSVTVLVDKDDVRARRWVERLGFEPEKELLFYRRLA